MELGSFALVLAAFTVAAVPVATHVIAGRRLHKDAWRFNTLFSGPWRFQIFQAFAWAFFALSAIMAAAVRKKLFVPSNVHTPALFGASVCSALISEVLVSEQSNYSFVSLAVSSSDFCAAPSARLLPFI